MICTFHLRCYERHVLQYLEAIKLFMPNPKTMAQPKCFGVWNDPAGYASYVPTHMYFMSFYNMYIERQVPAIHQHAAMLSAQILAIDHTLAI